MILGQKIRGQRAKKLVEKGAVLIDVRNPVAFRDGTLPGAINMSLRQVSSLMKYPKTTKFVFFGETEEDENLRAAVNYTIQLGFGEVFSLGSKENWDK